MLAIKFKRQGKKHQASFRIVVSEKRSKMKGDFTDNLGWYDPRTKKFEFNKERIEHWLKEGAKPTISVHNFLVNAGVIKEAKMVAHSTKKKAKQKEEASAAETRKKETVVPETPPETITEKPKEEGGAPEPVSDANEPAGA